MMLKKLSGSSRPQIGSLLVVVPDKVIPFVDQGNIDILTFSARLSCSRPVNIDTNQMDVPCCALQNECPTDNASYKQSIQGEIPVDYRQRLYVTLYRIRRSVQSIPYKVWTF